MDTGTCVLHETVISDTYYAIKRNQIENIIGCVHKPSVCQVSGKPVGENPGLFVRSSNFTPTGFLPQNSIPSNDMKMMEYETATTYIISFVNLHYAYMFWSKSADTLL